MQFDVITLFPEMFTALTQSGITRRAFEQNKWGCLSGILAISPATTIVLWMTGPMAVVLVW
jgi:hypothetical protein